MFRLVIFLSVFHWSYLGFDAFAFNGELVKLGADFCQKPGKIEYRDEILVNPSFMPKQHLYQGKVGSCWSFPGYVIAQYFYNQERKEPASDVVLSHAGLLARSHGGCSAKSAIGGGQITEYLQSIRNANGEVFLEKLEDGAAPTLYDRIYNDKNCDVCGSQRETNFFSLEAWIRSNSLPALREVLKDPNLAPKYLKYLETCKADPDTCLYRAQFGSEFTSKEKIPDFNIHLVRVIQNDKDRSAPPELLLARFEQNVKEALSNGPFGLNLHAHAVTGTGYKKTCCVNSEAKSEKCVMELRILDSLQEKAPNEDWFVWNSAQYFQTDAGSITFITSLKNEAKQEGIISSDRFWDLIKSGNTNIEVFKAEIQKNPELIRSSTVIGTLLYSVIDTQNVELVRYLFTQPIAEKSDPIKLQETFSHALQESNEKGNSILQIFYEKHPELFEVKNGATKELFRAALGGNLNAFQFLANHGVPVNSVDQYGMNPLMAMATEHRFPRSAKLLVNYLLQEGIQPTYSLSADASGYKKGNTVWHIAVRNYNADIIHFLCEAGLKPPKISELLEISKQNQESDHARVVDALKTCGS